MPSKRPPLDELISLCQSTIAAEGVTTAPGAAAGNSFVDAGLIGVGDNSFFSMLAVLYPGQPRLVDSFDITGFDNLTGEVTLANAYKGVAAPIPAGVPYKIITFRFVPAEVAAIDAKLGAFTAAENLKAILGDLATTKRLGQILGALDETNTLKAILGAYTAAAPLKAAIDTIAGYLDTEVAAILAAVDTEVAAIKAVTDLLPNGGALTTLTAYVDTLETAIGAIEGATTLHNKLTAARAALLDRLSIITAGGAGELTAARAAALQRLIDDLTAVRAGYLDNLIGAVTTGTFSLVNNINEQDCLVIAAGNQLIDIELDMNNLTQINTVREYVQTDGANYRQISAKAFPTVFDTGTKCVILSFVQKNSLYKITLQASVLEGAARNVPYRYITRDLS